MNPSQRMAALALAAALIPAALLTGAVHAQTHRRPAKPPAPAATPLADKIQAILADPALSPGRVRRQCQDPRRPGPLRLQRRQALHARLERQACHHRRRQRPAARTESLTWITNVVAGGVIDPQGVLHGDIVILGSGDPTLSRRTYPYHSPQQPAPPVPHPQRPQNHPPTWTSSTSSRSR
jgi:hypothetical protein